MKKYTERISFPCYKSALCVHNFLALSNARKMLENFLALSKKIFIHVLTYKFLTHLVKIVEIHVAKFSIFLGPRSFFSAPSPRPREKRPRITEAEDLADHEHQPQITIEEFFETKC